MSHFNNTAKTGKGKHLNYEERIKIETLSKIGLKSETIAEKFVGNLQKAAQHF